MPEQVDNQVCPYLGVANDPAVAAAIPTKLHRCYLPAQTLAPVMSHQAKFCLQGGHVNCPLYQARLASPASMQKLAPKYAPAAPTRGRRHAGYWAGAIGLVLLAVVTLLALQAAGGEPRLPVLVGMTTATPAIAEISAVAASSTPAPRVVQEPQALAVTMATPAVKQVSERFTTPTPEAGGEVFLLRPDTGDAGWWSSSGDLRNHLGDSFLYAGSFAGQAYIAGARFDLSRVPRGAPIVEGQVRLTGMREDRLRTDVDATWMVQLLAENAVVELAQSDFLTFYSAPASITLFPQLHTGDLGKDRVNVWTLDEPTRQWLAQQLLDGATSVTLRISAAGQNGDTLFAWDSGLGPETGGNGATLLLSVGAPPPTPPPLPTKQVIVATLTPVPENVLTVLAQEVTATAEANAFGTRTPFPYQVVTPTPFPENLATVQAIAVAEELPPVLVDTPVPANAATAQFDSDYATAVALTTGTFTPVPIDYVTPMLVYPSPPAENVATAAARVVAATVAAVAGESTPTPLPRNAVMAVYAYATATAANQETAIAMVNEQNVMAITTGTPTPTPWNLVVITAVPSPTPTDIPLPTPLPLTMSVELLTPTLTPTPTRQVSAADLAQFRGMVLFLSDRSGSSDTWVMDPKSGQVIALITDPRLMEYAREQNLAFSPDRRDQAIVRADNNGDMQIQILSVEYGTTRQITHFRDKLSYDPAWSPLGDQIAFVSTNSGNDEIYLVDLEGRVLQQLTQNTWEWDKHPTWSPDAQRIIFYSNRDSGRRQLWIMNADGSGQHNLSNNEYNDWDPVWIR